jgi:hypothetical protein
VQPFAATMKSGLCTMYCCQGGEVGRQPDTCVWYAAGAADCAPHQSPACGVQGVLTVHLVRGKSLGGWSAEPDPYVELVVHDPLTQVWSLALPEHGGVMSVCVGIGN